MAKLEDVDSQQGRRYRDLVIELNGEAHEGYNRVIAVARRRAALGRVLHIFSGLLALLSGSAITGVATKVLDANSWQIASAAIAFSSGAISLIVSSVLSDKETHALLQIASEFFTLREDGSIAIQRPVKSDDERFKDYQRLTSRLAQIRSQADRYVTFDLKDDLPPRA